MSDPHWDTIHAGLDLAEAVNSTADRSRGLDIGDFAFCHENTRLRHVFYEFLLSKGFDLTKREARVYEDLQLRGQAEEYSRPCVIVERVSPDVFEVCFLTSLNSDDEAARWSSVITRLSIPCGNNQEGGIRAYPPLVSRMLLALPVQRSYLTPITREGLRQQLSYGELERLREWSHKKTAELIDDQKNIRIQEVANLLNKAHPANKRIKPSHKTTIEQLPFRKRDKETQFGDSAWASVYKRRFITPHPTRNNIRWILEHAGEHFTNASRFLSLDHRPAPPPFRLPRPFYSPLLRASAAFVRHRIFP
ncbi:hypothetical protein B0H19DRAFT_512446 [Mycena capillaripes]|nr:hypothetical protein B0H19DRAFT_512446 [Mycena capillaripes]